MDVDTMRRMDAAIRQRKGDRVVHMQEDGRLHLQRRQQVKEGPHAREMQWQTVQTFADHAELAAWLGVEG